MEAIMSLPRRQEQEDHHLAVLYTRVSSTEQSVAGFSLPAQRQLLRDYALKHGFEIEAEFSEVESAGRTGRSAFGAMMEHLKKNRRIRAILAEKTDRLYRNIRDWLAVGELDVEVHLVKENVVLSEDSVSTEKFLHGIKVLVAKNYCDNLSEEARKGMLEKARQGHWPTRAPHGYRNVMGPNGKRIIEPDPDLGPQVLQIFRWYATGKIGIRQLTDKAVRCGMKDRRSMKPIQRTTINNILRNPLYMGEFYWGGERFIGVHQPLVSAEIWEAVQSILSGRSPRHRVREKHSFSFSRLIECGRCEEDGVRRKLVAERQKEKYVYYRCERCKRCGRAEFVREESIEKGLCNALAKLRDIDGVLQRAMEFIRPAQAQARVLVTSHLVDLQRQVEDLQARLDRAYDDYARGRIDTDFFERRQEQWRGQISQLMQQAVAAGEKLDSNFAAEKLELAEVLAFMKDNDDPAKKRALIEKLCSNCLWTSGSLRVEWR